MTPLYYYFCYSTNVKFTLVYSCVLALLVFPYRYMFILQLFSRVCFFFNLFNLVLSFSILLCVSLSCQCPSLSILDFLCVNHAFFPLLSVSFSCYSLDPFPFSCYSPFSFPFTSQYSPFPPSLFLFLFLKPRLLYLSLFPFIVTFLTHLYSVSNVYCCVLCVAFTHSSLGLN